MLSHEDVDSGPVNSGTDEQRNSGNFDDEVRELKYQYRSPIVRLFFLHVWPKLHYFWLHMIYIITCSLVGGVIVWSIELENPRYDGEVNKAPTFIDATLSATSAASSTAMATLDFWNLRVGSQVTHLMLTQICSSSFVAAMTAFIRRKSLSVWLSKHPQRKCRESDNVVLCHGALLRLGITLLAFNVLTVVIGWAFLTIYSNTALKGKLSDLNPEWFSFFTVVCAYNQTGYGLTEEGLIPFNNHIVFALIVSIIILISNMLLPVVMRGIIRMATKLSSVPEPWQFLLDHPRICSTVLFPALQTRILAGNTPLSSFPCLFD
jgi:Trk-type K+ transport system membrane component